MKINNLIRTIVIFILLLVISLPLINAEELNLVTDANGNLVTGDSFYREYNELNQLVRIRSGNLSNGQILEEFIWHPTEERILVKDVFSNGVLNYSVYYVNKNYIHIENSSGNYSEKYVYQDGTLVAQITTDGQKQFVHSDHLGSTSLITDINGNVVENSFFEPFGSIIEGGKASRYDFTGKEKDEKTGEFDFGARMYKSEWGKFVISDKLFENVFDAQLLNHYAFVRNNPFKYTDSNGDKLVSVFGEDDEIFIYEEKIDETREYVGQAVGIDYGDPAVNEGRAYHYEPSSARIDYMVKTTSGDVKRLSSLIREYGGMKSGSVENQARVEQSVSCLLCSTGGYIKGTAGSVVRGLDRATTTISVYESYSEGSFLGTLYQTLGYVPVACFLPCATNLLFYNSGGLQLHQKIYTPPSTGGKKPTSGSGGRSNGNSGGGGGSSSSGGSSGGKDPCRYYVNGKCRGL